MVPARSLGMRGGEVKALTPAQQKTKRSAVALFVCIATAVILVFITGIDNIGDWIALAGCVVCILGNVWYIQDDIKAALREAKEEHAP